MNLPKIFLYRIFWFSAGLLVLHLLALWLFLYWQIWWFDIPMHFFGGFVSALIILSVMAWRRDVSQSLSKSSASLALALLGALVVGVLWEVFEYQAGLVWNAIGDYPLDTGKDLVLDIVGGYVAYRYFLVLFTKIKLTSQ